MLTAVRPLRSFRLATGRAVLFGIVPLAIGIGVTIAPWLGIIPLFVATLALFTAWPRFGLVLTVFALPLQGAFVVTAGAHFQVAEVLMLVLVVAFVVRTISKGRDAGAGALLVGSAAIVVVVVIVSSLQTLREMETLRAYTLTAAYAAGRSAPETRSFITALWAIYCLGAFVVTQDLIRTRAELATVVRWLLRGAAVASAYGVVQWTFIRQGIFILLPGDIAHQAASQWTIPRAYATFVEPATFAAFLLGVLPITAALLWARDRAVVRRGELVALGLLQLSGFIVSFSVGQWFSLATVAPLLVVGAFALHVPFRTAAGYSVITMLTVGIVTAIGASALGLVDLNQIALGFERKLSNEDLSLGTRLSASIIGMRMFVDSHLLGVGIGNFPFIFPSYAKAEGYVLDYGGTTLTTPASLYVLIPAELGLAGIVVGLNFAVRLASVTVTALRGAVRGQLESLGLLFGLTGSVFAIAVSSNFVDNLFALQNWVSVALLLVAVRLVARPDVQPPEYPRKDIPALPSAKSSGR